MLTEGQILEGKYRVDSLLSRGGMGAIFVGEHTRIKRKVAIKVLHDEKHDSENTKRFEKEAEAAGRIGSDHIVEVLDFGTTPDGDRFMVMEFLDGETLKTRLKRIGRMEPAQAIPVVIQILDGLAAAHAAGIIHRDLKPDNVFIMKEKAGRKDFVKIVDFGISKFDSLLGESGEMTKTGAVIGTPFYMSPEQARAANEVDFRSDLYSVGVLLYEATTGVVPFKATTLTELMFKIVFEDPPHPLTVAPSLDRGFVALVLKAMARDSSDRFQTAKEMRDALDGWTKAPAAVAAQIPAPRASAPHQGVHGLAGTAVISAPPSFRSSSSNVLPVLPSLHTEPWPRAPIGSANTETLVRPGPTPVAPTQPWSAESLPNLPHQSGAAAGAPQMYDTQKGWDASRAAPKKSRAGAFALVAILALGAAGAAAFFVVRGGGGEGRPAQGARSPAPTAAPPTAPPEAPKSAKPPPAPTVKTVSPEPSTAPSSPPPSVANPPPSVPVGPAPHGGRPAPVKTPSPAKTVKDYGY